MNKLVFTSLLLLAPTLRAEDKFNLFCMTEFPTTSFVARDSGDTVVLEVFHHNGTKYMPVFDGLATPNDVKTISDRARVLSDLGTHMRFEWPREKCKKQEDLVQQCFGPSETQNINGHKVNAWNFDSVLVMEKTFAGKFNSYKVTLNLDVDGKSYYIPMKYAENECTDQMTMKVLPKK